MVASDFRAEARRKLEGKWGKAACISLAFFAFSLIIEFISGMFSGTLQELINLVIIVINVPLSFGFIISLFKLYNDEEIKAFDFLKLGFNNFRKSWGIAFRMFLKMLVPLILLVVSYVIIGAGTIFLVSSSSSSGFLAIIGYILFIVSMVWLIYKSYSYQLSYFIAIDHPEISSKEAVEKSEQFMNGKRWKLFCLGFSFIGWILLSCIALYIPILWVMPYMYFAIIAFYKYASGNDSNVTTEVIEENNN